MTIARSPELGAQLIAMFSGPVAPGAQLVVGDGETAVFARHGQLLRVLDPGSYEVPAEYSGDGVEVYFVTTRPMVNVKFGGPVAAVPGVRGVFGEFDYQVTEPAKVVQNSLGMRDTGTALEQFVKGKMMTAFKEAVVLHGADPSVHEAVMGHVTGQMRSLEEHGVKLLGIGRFMAN